MSARLRVARLTSAAVPLALGIATLLALSRVRRALSGLGARRFALAGVLAAFLIGAAPEARGEVVKRASVDSNGTQANASSFHAAISATGRFVAFQSNATNLVTGDMNAVTDIFVYDRLLGTTERVSVSSGNSAGDGNSINPSISADGRFVAFESEATNLVVGDTNNRSDIFVRDRLAGTTERVSVASDGSQGGLSSNNAAISANGLFVAFSSLAPDLVATDTNAALDIFVRDRFLGTTERVSVASNGTESDGSSDFPAISGDGRIVAFHSLAKNLATGGGLTNINQIFLHDRVLGGTFRVAAVPNGTLGNADSLNPSLSYTGNILVFESDATNLIMGDTNAHRDVFVFKSVVVSSQQLTGSIIARASVASDGSQVNFGGLAAAVSSSGRFVAFESNASNLVPGTANGFFQIFVHDRSVGTTTRVSSASDGTQGGADSHRPTISADGRVAAFHSFATNLVTSDTNNAFDIFVGRVVAGPSWLYTGAGAGGGPDTRGFDATGSARFAFFPYDAAFTGGVHVAVGDVNGDGIPDIITAAGPGGGPHVRVFSGINGGGVPIIDIMSFFAYPPGFTGGVFVAAGDVDGDGKADIITGAGPGGGPHVQVFSGATGQVIRSFFAYAPGFTGGVFVAAGDVDGDGKADIITGAGPGGGPHVQAFSGATGQLIRSFFAYAPSFTGGVRVAAADVSGDARADIITAAGPGGGPHVEVFRGTDGTLILSFFAYTPAFTGGVFPAGLVP